MNIIAIPLHDFDTNSIIYKEKNPNKLIPNSTFSKLMYSNEDCYITGIPLFCNTVLPDYTYDKFKKEIKTIEEQILKMYIPSSTKTVCYKMYNHLSKNYNKNSYNNNILIKFIGIWESQYEYGITYRISNHP